MSRIALPLIVPVLALLSAPAEGRGPAAIATAREAQVRHARIVDLRPQLANKRWREGRNTFYRDSHIKLVAEVRRGKVISVQPINISGKPLTLAKKSGRTPRPCIICYNLDQPLASTCIEVPCWMVPILKPILR